MTARELAEKIFYHDCYEHRNSPDRCISWIEKLLLDEQETGSLAPK